MDSTVASLRYYRSPESKERKNERRRRLLFFYFLLLFFPRLYFLSFLCVLWFSYSSFLFFFDVFCVVIRSSDLLRLLFSIDFLASSVCRVIRLHAVPLVFPHPPISPPISLHSCTIRSKRTSCPFIFLSFYFLSCTSNSWWGWLLLLLLLWLIQFLPEEENKIISAFAGCESEFLTVQWNTVQCPADCCNYFTLWQNKQDMW